MIWVILSLSKPIKKTEYFFDNSYEGYLGNVVGIEWIIPYLNYFIEKTRHIVHATCHNNPHI